MNRITLLDVGIKRFSLHNENYIFEIDDEKTVGYGGSCLVYHAKRIRETTKGELYHRVILKEFYPAIDGDFIKRKENGELIFPDETQNQYIADKRERFENGHRLYWELHNDTGINNYVPDASELLEGNGTYYIVIDYNEAIRLRDYMKSSDAILHDFLGVVRMMANAIEAFHKKGYIHFDLNPDNILYFYQNGMIRLMDIDSCILKEELTCAKRVSFTDGYAAPELYRLKVPGYAEDTLYNLSKRGETVDLFSIGAMLYEYLFKEPMDILLPNGELDCTKSRKLLKSYAYETNLREALEKRYRTDVPDILLQKVQDVLRKLLNASSIKRYQTISDFIVDLDELIILSDFDISDIIRDWYTTDHAKFEHERKVRKLGKVSTIKAEEKQSVFKRDIEGLEWEYSIVTNKKAKKIVIKCGDLCEDKNIYDIAVCSAFKEHYNPSPGTFIGSLLTQKSISVEELAKDPFLDLRGAGCWISKEINSNLKRIACVELIELEHCHDKNYINDVILTSTFSTLKFIIEYANNQNIGVKSIVLPLIGTGKQGIDPHFLAGPLLNQSLQALQQVDNLEMITFYERDQKKAQLMAQMLDSLLGANNVPDIFISYHHQQYENARSIKNYLEQSNVNCWMAPDSFSAEGDYLDEVPVALGSVKLNLLLLTPEAEKSPWIKKEVGMVIGAGKNVLTLQMEDFYANDTFQFMLAGETIIDAYAMTKQEYLEETLNQIQWILENQE